MAAKLEQLEGLKRQLIITVNADDVKKLYGKKLNNFARTAKIQGFRPGKVPVSVVEQRYGNGLLFESAAEMIDSSFQSEVIGQEIKLAGNPQIDFNHETLKLGESFDFKATFEVYPEIQLKDLTDAEIESVSGEVSDDDVSSMLIRMRTQHSEWLTVARESKLGDRIKIDFDGMMDGAPLDRGSAKGSWLELGSNSMIPGFEDGLIGAKQGDTRTLNIAFPAEYHVETLRGKPVVFTVTVHEVQEPKLPALDDEFAKKMGVSEGAEALKKQIKEKMQAELHDMARSLTKRTVLDKLISLNALEAPAALVDAEVTHLQDMTRQQMQQYSGGRMSEAEIKKFPLAREPYLEDAKKRVVLGLLLAEVIKAHKIEVDQNKVLDQLKKMAAQYGDVEQILPLIQQNKRMVSDVEAFILEEQAIDVLLSKARVLEVKKSYDAIVNAK